MSIFLANSFTVHAASAGLFVSPFITNGITPAVCGSASYSVAGDNSYVLNPWTSHNCPAFQIPNVFRYPELVARTETSTKENRHSVTHSPSGLNVYPEEGRNLLMVARDVLAKEVHIPNKRIVINIQNWSAIFLVTKTLETSLQQLAEESGIVIGLKTKAAPFAYEFEPALEKERQLRAGKLAAQSISKDYVEHSVTLEAIKQRRKSGRWGPDRIVLDGIQNHLPGDSGGDSVAIRYVIMGKWYTREQGAKLAAQGHKVDAVVFLDNGRGFDYRKLGLDYSDKPEDERTRADVPLGALGQFGEGLKLASASSLIEGMTVQIFSRNWMAIPKAMRLEVDGKTVHKLYFDVDIYNDHPGISGSVTVYHKPTHAFLDVLSQIERSVLYFRPNYQPMYSDGQGNAVVDKEGDLFVKGMLITSDYKGKLLFSYDLNTNEIPRDRDHVKERVIGNLVGSLVADTDDIELIKKVLSRAVYRDGEGRPDFHNLIERQYVPMRWEKNCGNLRTPKHPELWERAFAELFGPRAVIQTDEETGKMARLADFDVLYCSDSWFKKFLTTRCHVKTDKDVGASTDAFLLADLPDVNGARLLVHETSFTLSSRAKKWGPLRFLLDAAANHMPADSGGTAVKIQLKLLREGYYDVFDWVTWEPNRNFHNIQEVSISDDGRGYNHASLKYAVSDKPSNAVGQFGEGLKLASATALRMNDVRIKFRSRDWVATPFAAAPMMIGRKSEEPLCFHVLDGVPHIDGSTTTIRGIDDELGKILRHLDDYVLPLRTDLSYLYSSNEGSMFRESPKRLMPNGTVFNKGIYITSSHAPSLLFSYDLNTDDISPDRDNVDVDVLRSAVSDIVSSSTNPEVIKRILEAAADGSGTERMEFVDAQFDDDVAQAWRDVFYEMHGKDGVLFTGSDSALEAEHRGFKVLKLNEKIANTLHAAGIEYDQEVVSEGFKPTTVPYEELTPDERLILEDLIEVDDVLGLPPFEDIRVFTEVYSRTGRNLTNRTHGYLDGDIIYINRSDLESWAEAKRTYVHERGHWESEAADATDEFREFFEYYVSALTGKELAKRKADPSYEVGVEAFARRDVNEVNRLRDENSAFRSELHVQNLREQELKQKLAQTQSVLAQTQAHLAHLSNQALVSGGLVRNQSVSFVFDQRMVYVQPKSKELHQVSLNTIEQALLGRRTGLEWFFGLFGRPNAAERAVDVFVSKPLPWRLGDPRNRDVEVEHLNGSRAVRFLRKIAKRERPGGGSVAATTAVHELRQSLYSMDHDVYEFSIRDGTIKKYGT